MKKIKVYSLALALSLIGAINSASGLAQSTQDPSKAQSSASCCKDGEHCCKEGASCCARRKADGKKTDKHSCPMNHKDGASCCGEGASCCTDGACGTALKK